MPRPFLVALAAVLALLAAPLCAALASGRDVLDDCTDDEVMSKTYTQKEYRDALSQLAADADQYGNCREVIRRAQLKAASGSKKKGGTPAAAGPTGGGTGGGDGAIGSAPATDQLAAAKPEEREAVEQARAQAPEATPATPTVDTDKVGTAPGASRTSDVPAALIAVLALLLVAALAMSAVRLRSLVDSRRA